jgi:hypothetical protein
MKNEDKFKNAYKIYMKKKENHAHRYKNHNIYKYHIF